MKLGEKIYNLRREKGWSQDDLSEKINVSRQTISKWENNQNQPGLEQLKSLASAFEITIDELVNEKKQEEIQSQETNKTVNKKSKLKWVLFILAILIISAYIGFVLYRYLLLGYIDKRLSEIMYPAQNKILLKHANSFADEYYHNEEIEYSYFYFDNGYFIREYRIENEVVRVEYENLYESDGYYDIDLVNKTYIHKDNRKSHYLEDLNVRILRDEIYKYFSTLAYKRSKLKIAINPKWRIQNNEDQIEIFNYTLYSIDEGKVQDNYIALTLLKNNENATNLMFFVSDTESKISTTYMLGDYSKWDLDFYNDMPIDLSEYTLIEN